jgi:hypothetical protein
MRCENKAPEFVIPQLYLYVDTQQVSFFFSFLRFFSSYETFSYAMMMTMMIGKSFYLIVSKIILSTILGRTLCPISSFFHVTHLLFYYFLAIFFSAMVNGTSWSEIRGWLSKQLRGFSVPKWLKRLLLNLSQNFNFCRRHSAGTSTCRSTVGCSELDIVHSTCTSTRVLGTRVTAKRAEKSSARSFW